MKQQTENEEMCSGCKAEPRIPGQRYGRNCHREASRKYRKKIRRRLALIREFINSAA